MKFQLLLLLAIAFLAALALVESHIESEGGNLCWSNGDCSEGEEYCQRAVGNCNGNGYCQSLPSGCVPSMVCGCNGMNYGSECDAAQEGVTVAHEGQC